MQAAPTQNALVARICDTVAFDATNFPKQKAIKTLSHSPNLGTHSVNARASMMWPNNINCVCYFRNIYEVWWFNLSTALIFITQHSLNQLGDHRHRERPEALDPRVRNGPARLWLKSGLGAPCLGGPPFGHSGRKTKIN
jgi:hypothetical protein